MPQDVAAREPSLPPSVTKVVEAGKALGLSIAPRLMPSSTRTAQEAAAACGCAVAQIVKSLLFTGATSGRSYLLLVAGANRVDERAAMRLLGEALEATRRQPRARNHRLRDRRCASARPCDAFARVVRRGSPRLRCRLGGRRPSERRLPGRSESPRARHRSDSREAELEPSTRGHPSAATSSFDRGGRGSSSGPDTAWKRCSGPCPPPIFNRSAAARASVR